MKKACVCIAIVMALVLCGCTSTQGGTQGGSSGAETSTAATRHEIAHRYASASEARDLLLSNDTYYAGFSQNDLDFRMDGLLAKMATASTERGYALPPLDEVTFVKTTMAEECNAGGYTHGTTIFLSAELLDSFVTTGEFEGDPELMKLVIWHELFHYLTRYNPDFRVDVYKLIHFTVHDADYTLPPSVAEYHISNPDVEHHNSST